LTLHRFRAGALEASFIAAELAAMLAAVVACKIAGHAHELRWQDMSTGRIGVCPRCGATIVPIAPSV
jgi:hypothetical protein